MPVTNVRFTNLGAFSDVNLELDSQVNVFTGPNNSGKSTILWLLAELLVYPFGMPRRLRRSATCEWWLDYSEGESVKSLAGTLPVAGNEVVNVLRSLGHTSFVPAQRHSGGYRSQGPKLDLDIDRQLEHEIDMWLQSSPAFADRDVAQREIRRTIRESREAEPPDFTKRRNMLLSGPYLMTDEAIVQKIVDLDYASYRLNRPTMRTIIDKTIEVASEITEDFPMSFRGVGEDDAGLFPEVNTSNGPLPVDFLSQGTQSTIQWLAHFLFGYAEYYDFPENLERNPATLIIDEIDAHLHPTWQRRIIRTLTKNFPNLQIFCSTHSPLTLAGLKEGQVHLVRLDPEAGISVSTNESDVVGWTADEILRSFLDIDNPVDLQTADDLERLGELRRQEELSGADAQELEVLRNRVNRRLIGGPASGQVTQILERLRDARGDS